MAVYYFSPTGNTRRVAEGLDRNSIDLTLPEGRASAPVPAAGERFTLVFPVHGHRVPKPLADWLRKMPPVEAPACLICTYGSVGAGGALGEAARLVERRGMYVAAAAELPGPHSYAIGETAYDLTRGGEPDLAGAAAFYRAVQGKNAADKVRITPRWDPAMLLPHRVAPVRWAVPRPRPENGCRGCGACRRVCPTGAAADRQIDCIRCGACVQACTQKARKLRFRTELAPWFLSKTVQKRPPRFIL